MNSATCPKLHSIPAPLPDPSLYFLLLRKSHLHLHCDPSLIPHSQLKITFFGRESRGRWDMSADGKVINCLRDYYLITTCTGIVLTWG